MKLVAFPGTGEWDPNDHTGVAWFQRGSTFSRLMSQHGFDQALPDDQPAWSSALAGTPLSGPNRKARPWWYGVAMTDARLRALPAEDRNLIAVSHGGQPATILAGRVPCRSLITVGTPVRRDMRAHYLAVGCPWLHVFSRGWGNRWQYFGQLFDRGVSLGLQMPPPAHNERREGIGHIDLVRRPDLYEGIYRTVVLPFLRDPQGTTT